jgi:hypothetical protein
MSRIEIKDYDSAICGIRNVLNLLPDTTDIDDILSLVSCINAAPTHVRLILGVELKRLSNKVIVLQAGIDSSGLPYFDLSDRKTARVFIAQAEAFRGIKIT